MNPATNPPPPQAATKETSKGLKSGHEFVNTVIESHNFGTGQPSQRAQWDFEGSSGTGTVTQRPRYSGHVAVKTTASFREVRASLRVRFFLFNERVLRFELGVRQLTRAWTSFSLVGSRIDVVNIRPYGSQIFRYCGNLDFDGVKMMLEQGRASIHDVDDRYNAGLLEHVMIHYPGAIPSHTKKKTFKMIQYLMHQGCAPSYKASPIGGPVIIQALRLGFTDIVRFMLQQNVSFEMLDPRCNPAMHLFSGSQAEFHEQLSLLHTCGWTDWARAASRIRSADALSGAIAIGSVSDIIYAAEVLKLRDARPRRNIRSGINVEIAVALLKSRTSLDWIRASVRIFEKSLKDAYSQHWILFNECTLGLSSVGKIGWVSWWKYFYIFLCNRSWMFSSTV
ncbi:hypothetical protein CTA2_3647, partial [Colletotrichum tanaceti]